MLQRSHHPLVMESIAPRSRVERRRVGFNGAITRW